MCRRREHKDKMPGFIYAAWRFVTTQGDKCLLEAQGISSVIMEHINWFCSDFRLYSPDLLCISEKQSSFMMPLSWLELKNKAMRWWEALFLILLSKRQARANQWRYGCVMPAWYFYLNWVRRRMMEQLFNSFWLHGKCSLSSVGLPTKAPREGFKQHRMPKHTGICLLAGLLL